MRVIVPELADDEDAEAPPPQRPKEPEREAAPVEVTRAAPAAVVREEREPEAPPERPRAAEPATPDLEAEERRKRWRERVRTWLGG
jgi:hypothetical protein